jgi:hypothetical protein
LNFARYWALQGDRSKALQHLRKALDMGYADVEFWQEHDLDTLRSDPEFQEIAAEVKRRVAHQ